MSHSVRWILTLGLLLVAGRGFVRAEFQSLPEPRIQTGPVARLQERLDQGEVSLDYSRERGYLDSLLELLEVPPASQTLVFSKTSLQSELINPGEPRALFFNDDVYVGFVPKGPVLELASVDPVHGTTFYTLSQEESDRPAFQAEGIRCISCHLPTRTDVPVPRLMVMSVMPNDQGDVLGTDVSLITDASALARRWGGWFVTGTGGAVHRGNMVIGGERAGWELGDAAHLTSLKDRLDVSPYPREDSNIVALMLLVHQSHVHNLIGEAGSAVRAAIEEEEARERYLSNADPEYSPDTLRRLEEFAEPLVEALFFVDAAPLDGLVEAPSEFAALFESLGPEDAQGRSLRDLDLETRLLRYPLSYLVYSDQFDQLPELALDYVYRRIREIVEGRDETGNFGHLSEEARRAILEILADTKPEFMAFSQGDWE